MSLICICGHEAKYHMPAKNGRYACPYCECVQYRKADRKLERSGWRR